MFKHLVMKSHSYTYSPCFKCSMDHSHHKPSIFKHEHKYSKLILFCQVQGKGQAEDFQSCHSGDSKVSTGHEVLAGGEHDSPALPSRHCHHNAPNLHNPHEKHLLCNALWKLLFHHGIQLKGSNIF